MGTNTTNYKVPQSEKDVKGNFPVTAHFLDVYGKNYRVTMSVSLGENGKMIYNIGQMKKEAHPKIKGSRATSDDGPRGFAPLKSRVPQNGGDMLLYDIVNLQRTQIKEKSKRTVPPAKNPAIEVVHLLLMLI